MTLQETLQALEELGTEQNRKVYRRHGVAGEQYGVNLGNLKQLKKRVKKDHGLALALWETGNHDARMFATMIADPRALDEATVDNWAHELGNYVLTDAFAGLLGKTVFAKEKMIVWVEADDEWTGRAGWRLLAHLAMTDQVLEDAFFQPYLDVIETDIHGRKNKVRDAMNSALIAIGIRNEALETRALSVAAAIGKVEVDHGETNCKTPDAAGYIHKTLEYRRKKARKSAAA